MATFVLIHGAGGRGSYWNLVAAELRAAGHDVVAPDLPCEDDSAGLAEYTDAVVDAIGDRRTAAGPTRGQSGRVMEDPWPLDAWPDVPTRFLLCMDDRFFPPEWMRGIVRARLGIEPDEVPGGHCAFLSQPKPMAAAILRAWGEQRAWGAPERRR